MVKEIYIRDESDPMFEEGIIDYTNEVESVISQIKMLITTKPGDVLGDYNFGFDISSLVFNTKRNGDEILSDLLEAINNNVYHGDNITIDLDINFGDSGYGYDYAVLDIIINSKKAIGFLIKKD